jgi:hypothetical protein
LEQKMSRRQNDNPFGDNIKKGKIAFLLSYNKEHEGPALERSVEGVFDATPRLIEFKKHFPEQPHVLLNGQQVLPITLKASDVPTEMKLDPIAYFIDTGDLYHLPKVPSPASVHESTITKCLGQSSLCGPISDEIRLLGAGSPGTQTLQRYIEDHITKQAYAASGKGAKTKSDEVIEAIQTKRTTNSKYFIGPNHDPAIQLNLLRSLCLNGESFRKREDFENKLVEVYTLYFTDELFYQAITKTIDCYVMSKPSERKNPLTKIRSLHFILEECVWMYYLILPEEKGGIGIKHLFYTDRISSALNYVLLHWNKQLLERKIFNSEIKKGKDKSPICDDEADQEWVEECYTALGTAPKDRHERGLWDFHRAIKNPYPYKTLSQDALPIIIKQCQSNLKKLKRHSNNIDFIKHLESSLTRQLASSLDSANIDHAIQEVRACIASIKSIQAKPERPSSGGSDKGYHSGDATPSSSPPRASQRSPECNGMSLFKTPPSSSGSHTTVRLGDPSANQNELL